jgi:hypothetical protein
MTHRVVVTDAVEMSGLHPLIDDPAFEVVPVDDSASYQFFAELATADGLIVRSATKVLLFGTR